MSSQEARAIAVAGEDAAIYAYGVISAVLSNTDHRRALAALRALHLLPLSPTTSPIRLPTASRQFTWPNSLRIASLWCMPISLRPLPAMSGLMPYLRQVNALLEPWSGEHHPRHSRTGPNLLIFTYLEG